MTTAKVKITHEARNDIIQIGRYTLAKWGLEQRDNYLTQMNNCIQKISKHELKGTDCSEIRRNYRKQLIGRHFIFFTWKSSSEVHIVRILHERMDVKSNLDERSV